MSSTHKTLPEFALRLELPPPVEGETLDLDLLFGRKAPCVLEIGTGNGYFLANEATRHPEINFIGVERDPKFHAKMVKRCARAELDHVRTTREDAYDLLIQRLGAHSLQRIYCYFSDPWPKRRHHLRRVVRRDLPPLLERVLTPGGAFWFKTDVGYYFNLAVTLFRERVGWRLDPIGRIPAPEVDRGEVFSNYERLAREKGAEVWGFHAHWDGPYSA